MIPHDASDGDAPPAPPAPPAATGAPVVRAEVREKVADLGDRFEVPVRTVTTIAHKTMALFPVRVWRRFLARNGFLLSAGMSYQALFASFAAVYVAFAVAGIWLGGNADAMKALASLIDTYIPGLIVEESAISPKDPAARSATGIFGWTGAIALVGFVWTAIGWITYSRMAVRSIFGLPKDTRSYVILKARDLLAALIFGAVMIAGAVLSVASTTALGWIFSVLGLDTHSLWFKLSVQGGAVLLVLLIDTGVLLAMFRFLSGAAVQWRRLWGGSLLGAVGLGVLQLGGGYLVGGATSNPLLAPFAVFIGLLLWFRATAVVILVAAGWIHEGASDRGESLRRVTPAQLVAEQQAAEQKALLIAARVEVREATAEVAAAGWLRRPMAKRHLRAAQAELDELSAPRPVESAVVSPAASTAASDPARRR